MSVISVGVIGAGYWGPNLVRNFSACPLTRCEVVCDSDPARLAAIGRQFNHLKLVDSVDRLLEMKLDAVVIATPVYSHFALASKCLSAGLHVLVEKPLAANVQEARQLVELADRCSRVLMVDHTYLFNNAVRKIKQIVDDGQLGELYYVDSVRINLGLFQKDINVVWDLAPHDLSIVDHVLGVPAQSISATGCGHTRDDLEDVAYVNVDYGERLLANFHVNWLSPVKVRQMIFAGSRRSLIYNELNVAEPIKVFDRGIEWEAGSDREVQSSLRVGYRSGDVWSPHVKSGEALQEVALHFAQCIAEGKPPLSDGRLGLRVVKLLEAAGRSIRAQGGRIVLSNRNQWDGQKRTIGSPELQPHLAERAVG